MTVATQSILVTFLGDDIAVSFPFTFPIYSEDHLLVYFQDLTTRLLVLVSSSDYNVTGIGNEDGGSVVFLVAPAATNNVIIARILPFTQDLDVLNQGGFYPENVESEFDLTQMQVQQVNQEVNRSVRGPLDNEWPELPTAPIRRAQLLGFTDDLNAYPTVDTFDIFFNMLASILRAGFGIEITIGDGIITITNTAPGGDELQDSWLLEDASSGGGGGGSDSGEFIRDTIFAALIGDGVTITQDDDANTITLTVTGGGDAESIYDAIALAITAGTGITVVNSDVGNTTTISADPEFIRDTIGTALAGGAGITVTVDDAGNTITLSAAPKILAIVSNATITGTFAYDQVNVTALAVGAAVANPTGTAIDGHGILYRIKDNGTARALTWGAQFRTFNDALPSTTVLGKTMYVGAVYNAADTKWDVLGVRQEA